MTDILIEELHNHLYLKSPYSENRWKQHANQHVKGISRDDQSAAIGIGTLRIYQAHLQAAHGILGSRQLYQFLDQLDTDTLVRCSKAQFHLYAANHSLQVRDDPTKNPEADTFAYIQLLIESLNTLGRLDTAVETIAHRLPVELFRVVEKCSSEVDQRYPAGLRGTKAAGDPLDFNNPTSKAVLNDLFGTLYARFEAIAEGHRVVHEVISGISKREGTRGSSSLTGGFRELWKLYQSEIRSLFHDYLANDGDLSYRMRDDDRGGSVFQRNLRDKSKVTPRCKSTKRHHSNAHSENVQTDRYGQQIVGSHQREGRLRVHLENVRSRIGVRFQENNFLGCVKQRAYE